MRDPRLEDTEDVVDTVEARCDGYVRDSEWLMKADLFVIVVRKPKTEGSILETH